MISKITWPNFRGTSLEGTQVLIKHMGFQDDVKYGKSKIFIRNPQTLFILEQERDKYIPPIIVYMQKVSGLTNRLFVSFFYAHISYMIYIHSDI